MAIDLGIDIGTANTLIYEDRKGIVLNEPSLVIKNDADGRVVAVGDAASDMMGRTPEGVSAVSPIRYGAITGFYAASAMLKYFVRKVTKSTFARVRAVISVPCGISDVEKRAVLEAAHSVGIREVVLMESPLAAAVGCGIDIGAAKGSMVVDIGTGTCETAVVALGGIVVSNTIKTAGATLDSAIVQHVKKQNNLVIGDATAEGIKIGIGSVYSGIERESIEINGRDMVTGLPKTATVTTDDVRPCISEYAEVVLESVKVTLEETPPELAADILESGIVLTGGGAMLRGLGRLINLNTEIPVFIAENPMECTAVGAGKSIDFMLNKRGRGILGR